MRNILFLILLIVLPSVGTAADDPLAGDWLFLDPSNHATRLHFAAGKLTAYAWDVRHYEDHDKVAFTASYTFEPDGIVHIELEETIMGAIGTSGGAGRVADGRFPYILREGKNRDGDALTYLRIPGLFSNDFIDPVAGIWFRGRFIPK